MTRIQDKVEEIERYLQDLELIIPDNIDEYFENLEKRLATERAFEKVIESVNDLAILFLKEKRLPLPSEEIHAFEIIASKNVISQDLGLNLKRAKGMRNFLAHQYDKVDDELVFNSIHDKLFLDVEQFVKAIKASI
jgi:uncharacterized protein YutE (UPF0331/DUF86 family)